MVKIGSLPRVFRGKGVKDGLEKICLANDVSFLALFGSFVNGNPTHKSDVDLLVKFNRMQDRSLLDLIRTEREMGRVLKRKVDLVTADGISPYFKNDVVKTMRVIYKKIPPYGRNIFFAPIVSTIGTTRICNSLAV